MTDQTANQSRSTQKGEGDASWKLQPVHKQMQHRGGDTKPAIKTAQGKQHTDGKDTDQKNNHEDSLHVAAD